MMDYINKLANNDYILTGLIILLIILVIIFFIVLFFGGKKDKKKDNVESNNDDFNNVNSNIDFNHEEYVKETTAEFELAPIDEVKPADDNISVETTEESPAYKVEFEENEMNNFSFDDLSKMISEELDKNEEVKESDIENVSEVSTNQNIPEVTFVDTFKEVQSEIKPVEVEKMENIANVFKKEEIPDLNPVLIDKKVEAQKNDEMVLPKLADAYLNKLNVQKTDEVNTSSEPIIKDEQTPLYARFNPESYEIDKKD